MDDSPFSTREGFCPKILKLGRMHVRQLQRVTAKKKWFRQGQNPIEIHTAIRNVVKYGISLDHHMEGSSWHLIEIQDSPYEKAVFVVDASIVGVEARERKKKLAKAFIHNTTIQ